MIDFEELGQVGEDYIAVIVNNIPNDNYWESIDGPRKLKDYHDEALLFKIDDVADGNGDISIDDDNIYNACASMDLPVSGSGVFHNNNVPEDILLEFSSLVKNECCTYCDEEPEDYIERDLPPYRNSVNASMKRFDRFNPIW